MTARRKIIVTTTIRPPTEAIERFDGLPDWTLIVVGDRRTPSNYRLRNGIYFSVDEQHKYNVTLSRLIGWDCTPRRNFGFLLAYELGADIVATVDDDNIPYPDWGQNMVLGRPTEVDYFETDEPCFDPLSVTNYPHLWHRGFPVQLLASRAARKSRRSVEADIQADLWDGDPDVDAICRLKHRPRCHFDPGCFPFSANRISPFNSQNTFVRGDLLPYYFMVPHVGRVDDIWGSYHLQSLGFKVVFSRPSVKQVRNDHDTALDMVDELLGYEKTISLVTSIVEGTYRTNDFWPERSIRAFEAYQDAFG